MKKALALFVSLTILGLLLTPINAAITGINSANTVIVLPTTKIVNGVPLHIGEDAITGSRLGAFLVLRGISQGTYTTTVSVPVEYHSVVIPDENQIYKLNPIDMPDVGVNVSDVPVGHAVVVQVDFSRVGFNSTNGMAEFLDRSVEIIFNENTTPLDIGGDYKVVSATVDGKDTMYFYAYLEADSESSSLGDSIVVGGWKIKLLDINLDVSKMLIELTYPSGLIKTKTMSEDKYYVMYVDTNGAEDFEEYDTYPSARINELLETGAKNVFLFTPTDFFVGINNAQMVTYDYWYYEKVKQYSDGDVYKGQWIWDIDPDNGLYTLYLHVNESLESFPRVFIGSGDALELPTGWGLEIMAVFQRDENGGIVGVEGYRFVRVATVTRTVSVIAPKVEATDDVYDFIIEDTDLTSLPSDKNVIIIGGWVSNKAWELLGQVYGTNTVDAIKAEVEQKGYVIKELDNPNNPQYKVIILAGKTYEETRLAVEKFMEEM
ncbi:S-layer protein precursor [Thermococcus onnurineus NA1]|uniref:S-layer protein n=1 Tax=Thermococcus onnurineus (strain NA1) TaxID=523850 RepID=B6YSF6_THEON|nr:S-layer protein [Thermococcus onnurineus]ACJ15488.1 S-layer protein precursor [Thermococcus onnurineus NA1]